MKRILYPPLPWLSSREDLGYGCPDRLAALRVVDCQLCGWRRPVAVYGCRRHGECSPWIFEAGQTVKTCVQCVADDAGK